MFSKTAKVSAFKSVFVPTSHVVMNLRWRPKEYWQKNRWQRWDICEESTVWHFVTRSTSMTSVKPGMSTSHFSVSTDPSCVRSAMYIQNAPAKNSELNLLRYNLHSLESGPGCVTISPTLLGTVLVWKQQNYLRLHAVDRKVFRILLGLLPPWIYTKEKRAPKWVNEWVSRPTLILSIHEIVYSFVCQK